MHSKIIKTPVNRGLPLKLGLLAGVILFVLGTPPAMADIYKYVDKYGRVTLTDRPDRSGYQKLVRTWKGWVPATRSFSNPSFASDRRKYEPVIAEAAAKNNLPKELVHAVVTAESAYDKDAVSRKGAVGLMQLMPETGRRYGVLNRNDPVANVHGGTHYLGDLMQMFKNDVRLAVAAYNAGENAVIDYGYKIPPFAETREYVRRVMQYYEDYKARGIDTGLPYPVKKPAARPSASLPLRSVAQVKFSSPE
ncbi:MAG TPA: lytic transglycosylase domain-containing protein [Gammaproteobacteria bacterium]|nr:lytic transglycosylase domain-containing protein [Gammaproteobacteria bacterium]